MGRRKRETWSFQQSRNDLAEYTGDSAIDSDTRSSGQEQGRNCCQKQVESPTSSYQLPHCPLEDRALEVKENSRTLTLSCSVRGTECTGHTVMLYGISRHTEQWLLWVGQTT